MTADAQRDRARARVAGLVSDLREQMAPRDLAAVLVGAAIELVVEHRTAVVAAAWLRLVAAEVESAEMDRERSAAKIERRAEAPTQTERSI